jgi:uncharacterized RDD family membrane protein YckC
LECRNAGTRFGDDIPGRVRQDAEPEASMDGFMASRKIVAGARTGKKTDAPHVAMTTPYTPPHLPRRLAAGFYDLLLVVALWFPATAIALAVFRNDRHLSEALYRLYLLAVAFAFFGWFWTHGGQTLGMRAWRLRLIAGNGQPPGLYQAFVRYVSMLIPWLLVALGLEFLTFPAASHAWIYEDILAPVTFLAAFAGFIWPLLDRQHLAWHDRLSHSCLTVLQKPARKRKSAQPADGDEAADGQ